MTAGSGFLHWVRVYDILNLEFTVGAQLSTPDIPGTGAPRDPTTIYGQDNAPFDANVPISHDVSPGQYALAFALGPFGPNDLGDALDDGNAIQTSIDLRSGALRVAQDDTDDERGAVRGRTWLFPSWDALPLLPDALGVGVPAKVRVVYARMSQAIEVKQGASTLKTLFFVGGAGLVGVLPSEPLLALTLQSMAEGLGTQPIPSAVFELGSPLVLTPDTTAANWGPSAIVRCQLFQTLPNETIARFCVSLDGVAWVPLGGSDLALVAQRVGVGLYDEGAG